MTQLVQVERKDALRAAAKAVSNMFALHHARREENDWILDDNVTRFGLSWRFAAAPRVFSQAVKGALSGKLFRIEGLDSLIFLQRMKRPMLGTDAEMGAGFTLGGGAILGVYESARPVVSALGATGGMGSLATIAVDASAIIAMISARAPYSGAGFRTMSGVRESLRNSNEPLWEVRAISGRNDHECMVALETAWAWAVRANVDLVTEGRFKTDADYLAAMGLEPVGDENADISHFRTNHAVAPLPVPPERMGLSPETTTQTYLSL